MKNSWMTPEQRLKLQGAAAAIFGLPCPYQGDTESRRIWEQGYELGRNPKIAEVIKHRTAQELKL